MIFMLHTILVYGIFLSYAITMIYLTIFQICKAINDIDSRSKLLTERYRKELKLRKKYFNELVCGGLIFCC